MEISHVLAAETRDSQLLASHLRYSRSGSVEIQLHADLPCR